MPVGERRARVRGEHEHAAGCPRQGEVEPECRTGALCSERVCGDARMGKRAPAQMPDSSRGDARSLCLSVCPPVQLPLSLWLSCCRYVSFHLWIQMCSRGCSAVLSTACSAAAALTPHRGVALRTLPASPGGRRLSRPRQPPPGRTHAPPRAAAPRLHRRTGSPDAGRAAAASFARRMRCGRLGSTRTCVMGVRLSCRSFVRVIQCLVFGSRDSPPHAPLTPAPRRRTSAPRRARLTAPRAADRDSVVAAVSMTTQ
jgi:hypothetical protein